MKVDFENSEEASKALFGRKHKVAVWDALLDYSIDPPERFHAHGLTRKLMREAGVHIGPGTLGKELDDLMAVDMLTEVDLSSRPEGWAPVARPFQRIESEGWEMVEAAVETFKLWFPGNGE